ncbi:hypothetical protein CMTB2_00254, partial [Caminibacter mediatlanticus TB-2]
MKNLSEIENISFIYSSQKTGHCDIVNSVSISGDYIVSGSRDETVKLWSIKEKNLLFDYEIGGFVHSVKLYNEYILIGHDRGIKVIKILKEDSEIKVSEVLDIAKLSGIKSLDVDNDIIVGVSFSGDLFYFNFKSDRDIEEKEINFWFIKSLMLGDSGVGKTTIACNLEKYVMKLSSRRCEYISSTEAMRMFSFNVKDKENTYLYELWDFGGQPGYQISHKQSFNRSKVVFLVIDLSRKYIGANSIEYWMNSFLEHLEEMSDEVFLFVIGTKENNKKYFDDIMKDIEKILKDNGGK